MKGSDNVLLVDLYKNWQIKRLMIKHNSSIQSYTLNRKECILLLELLDESRFDNYQPNVGLSMIVKVRYVNIVVYLNKIIDTITILKRNEMIPVNWDLSTEETLSLDRFLTSGDHYIDVKKYVTEFKKRGLELCNLLEEADSAAYGLHEHNKRMLIKMINNIISIVNRLIEVTN